MILELLNNWLDATRDSFLISCITCLGNRNEVEDLAQEVFLKVFKSLSGFDTQRSLKSWISRTTVNQCRDEIRKVRGRRLQLFADLTKKEQNRIEYLFERSEQTNRMSAVEAEESLQLLFKGMNKLPEKDRLAFSLRELEGFSYAEIGEVLETSQLAVRIRVSRSRKKLLQELSQYLFTKENLKL